MLPKHFRYSSLESKSYTELFGFRQTLKDKLEKSELALVQKKERLFREQNFTKWGV